MQRNDATGVVMVANGDEALLGELLELVAQVPRLTAAYVIDDGLLDMDDSTYLMVESKRVKLESKLRVVYIRRSSGDRLGGYHGAVLTGIGHAMGDKLEYAMVLDLGLKPDLALIRLLDKFGSANLVIAGKSHPRWSMLNRSLFSQLRLGRKAYDMVRYLFWEQLKGVIDPLATNFTVRLHLIEPNPLKPLGYNALLELLVLSPWLSRYEVALEAPAPDPWIAPHRLLRLLRASRDVDWSPYGGPKLK